MRRTRALHRKSRARVPYPVVALVGYTNAGKSTLFNALTGAACWPRTRCSRRSIRPTRAIRLPHGIEGGAVRHGGLHLRSADHADRGLPRHARGGARGRPHPACARHRRRGERCSSAPTSMPCSPSLASTPKPSGRLLEVWNKADRARCRRRAARLRNEAARDPAHPCLVSAVTGYGLTTLLAEIETRLNRDPRHDRSRPRPRARARSRTGSTRIAR